MSAWKQHQLSAAYPPMSNEEFDGFRADILKNGLKEPIVMLDGMVLDGWHRVQACQGTHVEIRTKEYQGDDPGGYVISKNTHRRHNTKSQLAAAALKVREIAPRGNPNFSDNGKTAQARKDAASANVRTVRTLQKVAEEAGVSLSVMSDANTAKKAGKLDEVISGKKSARRAAKEARPTRKPVPTLEERLRAEIVALKAKVADLLEKNATLVDELQSFADASEDVTKQKVEFEKLRHFIRTLESQRDDYMHQVAQWKRECKALRKRLGE